MLKVIDAIDYATDHNVRVTDDFIRKGSKLKAFYVLDDINQVMITQCHKGSHRYRVNGETYTRARAIVVAVNYLRQNDY